MSRDEYFLRGADWVSTRGTCYRRQVGCILTNIRGHILATGYNGVEAGAPHCNERVFTPHALDSRSFDVLYPHLCPGAKKPSGTGLDECYALHAEWNALLQCKDVFEIVTCYVTHSPCITCVKLLMGTSCKRIVFRNRYAHDEVARLKWLNNNNNVQNVQREWIHIPGEA